MVVTNYRMSEAQAEEPFTLEGLIGKEVLLCYVCAEYYKDPRVLPCQHTFCRGCLQRYFDSRQAESGSKLTTIPCPKCQSTTQVPQIGVTGFPLDTKLRQMKEVYLNALRKGTPSDSGTSQAQNSHANGGKMPYSAQDKENISNGRFAYRRRESPRSQPPEQDRPSSWYGQTTSESPGPRPSPRASWYGAGKKEESPAADQSRPNPFDRAARFAPRRRRKMERTFETNDEKVGFKPRDRLEEIINNVREEGTPSSASKTGSYRDRFFGSTESMNGSPQTGESSGFGSSRKRAKSPARSHSFNMQRPKAYEPSERTYTRPGRSGSFQSDATGGPYHSFTASGRSTPPGAGASFDGPPEAASTPTGTGTPVPPPRTRSTPRSPSAFAKPSPEPPKFKPKPPPPRSPTATPNMSYEARAAHAAASSPFKGQLSPDLHRSESEPPQSSFFGFHETPSRETPKKETPGPASPKDTTDGARKKGETPVGPPPESMDDETRELYDKMRDYYKRRAEAPPKDIPDIESIMKDSSDSEESDTEDFDTKTGPAAKHEADSPDGLGARQQATDTQTGPTGNGNPSSPNAIPTGRSQNGANDSVHNSQQPERKLSSETFATFSVGPDDAAEEAFAEVGEIKLINEVLTEDGKLDSGSDYDNASDYDNLESVPDEILRIVEDGDEIEPEMPTFPQRRSSGKAREEEADLEDILPMSPPADPMPSVPVFKDITIECPEMEEVVFTASSASPSISEGSRQSPCTPQVLPDLVWKMESSEYEMPTSIAFTSNANLVVAEYSTGCLQFYDEVGNVKNKVEGIKPFAISVNKANHVIVGDRKSKTIRVFDEFGYDVLQWEDNVFKWLCGIGTSSDGNFITFDREFCKIRISSPNGEKLSEFGTYGKGDTQFTQVDFLTVDSQDRIIVCDSGNHCVKIFDKDGRFIDKFGRRGENDGELQWPKGICVDSQDNIILADSKNKRISKFSPSGEFIQHLVTGCPNLYNVAYTSPGILGVSEYSLSGKSQVSVYTL